jgi:hypothetical protein
MQISVPIAALGLLTFWLLFTRRGSAGHHRRVLIVQIDNRDLNATVAKGTVPFWKHTAAINEQYARNHGYQYQYIGFKDVPEGRHSGWAHVAIVRQLLASGEYDYVMKLDSDAMFATTEPLDATIDFGPLERGEKDFVIALDENYYELYECPQVRRAYLRCGTRCRANSHCWVEALLNR